MFSDRILQYQFALESFYERIYIGYGLDKYSYIDMDLVPWHLQQVVQGAHNGYLAILTQYGIIFGFFVLFCLFGLFCLFCLFGLFGLFGIFGLFGLFNLFGLVRLCGLFGLFPLSALCKLFGLFRLFSLFGIRLTQLRKPLP